MECRDDFKRIQKQMCPPSRGLTGKKARWGCPCCRNMPLSDLKKHSRQIARHKLKQDLRNNDLED